MDGWRDATSPGWMGCSDALRGGEGGVPIAQLYIVLDSFANQSITYNTARTQRKTSDGIG